MGGEFKNSPPIFLAPGHPFDPQQDSTPLAQAFIICDDGLAERVQLRKCPALSVRRF